MQPEIVINVAHCKIVMYECVCDLCAYLASTLNMTILCHNIKRLCIVMVKGSDGPMCSNGEVQSQKSLEC